jgi:hypothetical protein
MIGSLSLALGCLGDQPGGRVEALYRGRIFGARANGASAGPPLLRFSRVSRSHQAIDDDDR